MSSHMRTEHASVAISFRATFKDRIKPAQTLTWDAFSSQGTNNSMIVITDNIDLKGQPLPAVVNKLEVMGNCPDGCCWIDAHNLSQIFVVSGTGYFTSHMLDMRNGKASGCGGAIWVAQGAHAGFFGSKFKNNTAAVSVLSSMA